MKVTQRFNVGQVVYVVSAEHNKVLPFQVVEEITKKTLKGDEVFYKVIYGADPTKPPRLLTEIKGERFTSLDEVKNHLMKNVTTWVTSQVDTARQAAAAWYKVPDDTGLSDDFMTPSVQDDIPGDPHAVDPSDDEASLVELPGGQVVKARIKGVK